MEKKCLCGNTKNYVECCGKFISGQQVPETALELMRSRYSAYVLQDGQYLYDTCSSKLKNRDDIKAVKEQNIKWIGLKIESFSDYEVVFMAYYKENNTIGVMKEHSFFVLESGHLRYDSGKMLEAGITRNELCPCGSGKKFKRCCI